MTEKIDPCLSDVAKIAAGLSEAQRRLLFALPETCAEAARFWSGEYRNHTRGLRTYRVLFRKRLSGIGGQITPRGLAVRTYLMETNNG